MIFGKLFGGLKPQKGGSQEPSIEALDNGALVVKGQVRITDAKGNQITSHKKTTQLCRCGASKKKPYCDRSHKRLKFDSSQSKDHTPDGVEKYEGSEISIHYNRLLCSHAAICGDRLEAVFDSKRDPWIIPDNGSAEEIKEIVKACPSGALRYSLPNEMPQHILSDSCSEINIEKDGPFHVCGIPFASERLAEGASSDKYDLCRCGASKNKPYCDGTHCDIGWESND